jgi:hypothetical protein
VQAWTGEFDVSTGEIQPNAWNRILEDNTILYTLDRTEMGQGTVTSHAMMVCEELEADPKTIKILHAEASRSYDNPDKQLRIQITGGSTGVGQSRLITDYVNATDTATVEAWTTTPTGTITYKIYGTAPSSGGAGLDAAGVRAAIGMSSANLDTQLSGLDGKIDTIDNLLDTEIGALTTAVADIPTNAELATALGTADDAVLAQVALVKAKTDSLTFTVANVLDANIQRINDVAVTGDGSGTPFDVA